MYSQFNPKYVYNDYYMLGTVLALQNAKITKKWSQCQRSHNVIWRRAQINDIIQWHKFQDLGAYTEICKQKKNSERKLK